MNRRGFLQSAGLLGAGAVSGAATFGARSLAAPAGQTAPSDSSGASPGGGWSPKPWLFWDLWHLDRQHNVELCQGEPKWIAEATYVDDVDGLAAWPTVYRDEKVGRWRMLYTARWRPYTMMVAESEDGIHFRPLECKSIEPAGGKLAPHHIFTFDSGSCGGVYVDPEAADGFPWKLFGHRSGKVVHERAVADPNHLWHRAATRGGPKPYMNEEVTLVSRDGLHWEVRTDYAWGQDDWHPEPPIFGFYNRQIGRHVMTVRPGWGDRRLCIQSTGDFLTWSGPEPLLQPDPADDDLCELYGMPVFAYEGYYVGLLWVFHCEQSERTRHFNRSVGPIDCQLAYSFDGLRFQRGMRRPFIPLNAPGEHGCGGVEPSCMIDAGGEIRIYSSASKVQHGLNWQARRSGMKDFEGILVHTLRKDGFAFLRSRGSWASLTTKPLVLFGGGLSLNVRAPAGGEVHFQLADLNSEPLPGYTFDDCVPLVDGDWLEAPLRWKEKRIDDLANQPLRLEMRFRAAELFALRGKLHFIDAQDMHLLADGQPLRPAAWEL